MGDVLIVVGLAVATISFVSYIVIDFRDRLGRIEGKLNRILDGVHPEEAKERRVQSRLAFEAKTIRNGRWAWALLVLWVLGVGAWVLARI